MKICIDSKNIVDGKAAAVVSNGYTASEINGMIARKLGCILYQSGHEVVFMKTAAIENQADLVTAADQLAADALISIRCQVGDDPELHGVGTFYYGHPDKGRALAAHIQTELAMLGYSEDRGLNAVEDEEAQAADIPAALVKCGAVTSRGDSEVLTDPLWQEKIAEAIAAGLQVYWG